MKRRRKGGHLQPMKMQLLLLGIVFVSAVWLLFQVDISASRFFVPESLRRGPDESTPGFLVNTKGCRIQELDPFDKKIRPFVHEEDIVGICRKFEIGRLVKADRNSVFIDWAVLGNTSSINSNEVQCKSCEFWRIDRPPNNGTYPSTVDTSYKFSENCKKIENSLLIENEEFIRVDCTAGDQKVYTDFFAFPRKNPDKSERLRRSDEVNVLLVGVDAVSRLNLHRQMPKTVKFLNTRVMAVEMLGYNKVGDNTFPNLVPVLSGLSEAELISSCWPNFKSVFDDCPMMWKQFKEAGFHTAYAEDSASIGLFNYQKIGFHKQPTDFYGQIFSLVSEDQIGSQKKGNTYLCVGNRLTVDVLLEVLHNFAIKLKDILSWGMFWTTSLSHDFLNYPRYGDDLHLNLMESLLEEGIFNTTIFVYLSDHGIRWGEIRETYQGYIEERLPFLWIAFPDWFEDRYTTAVRNLRTNRRRLTTPFDLHETLLDLINLTNIENSAIDSRSSSLKEIKRRGISLFLPVPEGRTCKDAGITDNWCTCHTSKEITTDDTTVREASLTLVDHLNDLLHGYAECSKLDLYKVHSARMEVVPLDPNEKSASKDRRVDYIVEVETVPGNGLFEATVRHNYNGEEKMEVSVLDPVSRLNTYGNQSICITHYTLKLYCYCIHKWGT